MGSFFIWLSFMVLFQADGIQQPNHFSWLPGTWEMKYKNGSSRLEIWKKKTDTTFSGTGLRINGADTILLESIELVFKDDTYWYIPTVPDQNDALPVPFKLSSFGQFHATFENEEHDFPQRIVYMLKPISFNPVIATAGDSLIVRVESMTGDGIDFMFLRR